MPHGLFSFPGSRPDLPGQDASREVLWRSEVCTVGPAVLGLGWEAHLLGRQQLGLCFDGRASFLRGGGEGLSQVAKCLSCLGSLKTLFPFDGNVFPRQGPPCRGVKKQPLVRWVRTAVRGSASVCGYSTERLHQSL